MDPVYWVDAAVTVRVYLPDPVPPTPFYGSVQEWVAAILRAYIDDVYLPPLSGGPHTSVQDVIVGPVDGTMTETTGPEETDRG